MKNKIFGSLLLLVIGLWIVAAQFYPVAISSKFIMIGVGAILALKGLFGLLANACGSGQCGSDRK